jgi:hypothetical protein
MELTGRGGARGRPASLTVRSPIDGRPNRRRANRGAGPAGRGLGGRALRRDGPAPRSPRTEPSQSLVGMTGFEPATLRSQSECATKLRHIPVAPVAGTPDTAYRGTLGCLRAGSVRGVRGCSSMAEPQPSKLVMRVRFPSPAPRMKAQVTRRVCGPGLSSLGACRPPSCQIRARLAVKVARPGWRHPHAVGGVLLLVVIGWTRVLAFLSGADQGVPGHRDRADGLVGVGQGRSCRCDRSLPNAAGVLVLSLSRSAKPR